VADRAIWKGVVAGVVGGLAASFAMERAQAQMSKLMSNGSSGDESSSSEQSDPATVKAADAIVEQTMGRHLANGQKPGAGEAMHYAFGSAMGALYGAMTQAAPRTAMAWGLPFGALLWLAADEIGVPALGLSKGPTETPSSSHAYALASHLVYGLTTDLVRRAVLAAA
jgi:uncharacterized membrane protein YagU involved in acid resistance